MKEQLCILFFISILTSQLFAQQAPVADFTVDTTKGCGFVIVNFTDQSTNTPTKWEWKFYQRNSKDTLRSSLHHPTFSFHQPGYYDVSLTAINQYGRSTKIKKSLIRVLRNPVSNFQATKNAICIPFDVSFKDLSTPGDTAIQKIVWDFGDGGFSTQKDPVHVFNQSGTFTVTLVVTDFFGCEVKNNTVAVTVPPKPIAEFTSTTPKACKAPLQVVFSNQTVGTNYTYYWQFEPGKTSTTASPTYSYLTNGGFDVRLVATDANGCKDTITKREYIQINTFKAKFGSDIRWGCYPLTVKFTDSSSFDALKWTWYFGDGDSAFVQDPQHTYKTPGKYTVILKVENEIGCISIDTLKDYITVKRDAEIQFSVNDSIACNTSFNFAFTDHTTGVYSWKWYFDDEDSSHLANPIYDFDYAGYRDVTLIVKAAGGCTDTLTKKNYIYIGSPHAAYELSDTAGCIPLTVNVKNISTSAVPIKSFSWNFVTSINSLDANPVAVFNKVGLYPISLTLTDTNNCTSTSFDSIYAGTPPEIIDFYADSLIGCYPFSTMFHANVKQPVSTYRWYINGGSINEPENNSERSLSFGGWGYFDVKLEAGYNGCFSYLEKPKYIYIHPPIPKFSLLPSVLCDTPYVFKIVNQSVYDHRSVWSFGDTTPDYTTTSHDTIVKEYKYPGRYFVKLIVSNDSTKCSSQSIQTAIASYIHAGVKQFDNKLCVNDELKLLDSTRVKFAVRQWNIQFAENDTVLEFAYSDSLLYTYRNAGTFDIHYVVEDIYNCQDSIHLTDAVDVFPLPIPDFTADQIEGCAPLRVEFTDGSHTVDTSKIIQWNWIFGDGTSSTTQNPVHFYTHRGTDTVFLKVTDNRGCDSMHYNSKFIIKPYKPYVNFVLETPRHFSEKIGCYSDSIHFINYATGHKLSYVWNFDDGSQTSTAYEPYHSFKVDTTTLFDVMLTATDSNGCDSSYVYPITISRPVADFGSNFRSLDCSYPQKYFHFYDSSSKDVSSWYWTFGDPLSYSNNRSNYNNPQHLYKNIGYYDITLAVENNYRCRDTVFEPKYIFIDGPQGTFTYTPNTLCAPDTVSFTANAINAVNYHWIFGDGFDTITQTNNIKYVYKQGKKYMPSLELSDTLTSPTDSVCKIPLIDKPLMVYAATPDFSLDATKLCNFDTVHFKDMTLASSNIDSLIWEVGNYPPMTGFYPALYMNEIDTLDVRLTVYVGGCAYSVRKDEALSVFNKPLVYIQPADTIACASVTSNFSFDQVKTDYPYNSFSWSIDQQTFTDDTVTLDFQQSEQITAQLSMEFENGCSYTYNRPVNVLVYTPPTAAILAQPTETYAYEPISFNGVMAGDITAHSWMFGDGAGGIGEMVSHAYTSPGEYNVKLIANVHDLCYDTAEVKINIISGLIIPNVMTPNGDGVNDDFHLIASGYKEIHLIIYNRWGKVVWETDQFGVFWDGDTSEGRPVSDGTYYYVVYLTTLSGDVINEKGFITVIRDNN